MTGAITYTPLFAYMLLTGTTLPFYEVRDFLLGLRLTIVALEAA